MSYEIDVEYELLQCVSYAISTYEKSSFNILQYATDFFT